MCRKCYLPPELVSKTFSGVFLSNWNSWGIENDEDVSHELWNSLTDLDFYFLCVEEMWTLMSLKNVVKDWWDDANYHIHLFFNRLKFYF